MTRCLIVTGDLVETGGMDRANLALAEHIIRLGYELHVVAHRIDARLRSSPLVQWHDVPRPLASHALGGPLLDGVGRFWVRRLRLLPQQVFVNGGNCLVQGMDWVHYVHAAYDPGHLGGQMRRLKSSFHRRAAVRRECDNAHRARAVIANSERTRNDILQLGVPPERVHTVYYGVDPTRFRPPTAQERASARADLGLDPEVPCLMFVGALGDRRKGFDTLFTAFSALCCDPAWHGVLVVVGQGRELAAWRQRASMFGLERRILFLGFRRDIPRLLAGADLFVAPTRYEAYGLGVHEALCCGIPAIVSASAGVAERYPLALNDLLLPDVEDAADLAERIRGWGRAPAPVVAAVERLGEELRRRSWSDMSSDMLRIAHGSC